MGIIDNELLDQLCECVQRNWAREGNNTHASCVGDSPARIPFPNALAPAHLLLFKKNLFLQMLP